MKRLILVLAILTALPAFGQIARVAANCTGTASCTTTGNAVGDLEIAYAGVNLSATAPSLATGWTSVGTSTINGTSTADSAVRMACKVATGTSEASNTFTSATSLIIMVYSGTASGTTATCASAILGTPVFTASTVNTTTTTETFGTVSNSNAGSWDVGFGYCSACTAAISTAPTGMANRNSITGPPGMGGHDTNGIASSFSTANVTLTTAGRVITGVVEIKPPTAATPTFGTNGGDTTGSTANTTIATATGSATICYTTDGTTPAASTAGTCSAGSTYSAAVVFSASGSVVKALATKTGVINSAVATSNAFTIRGQTIQSMLVSGIGGASSQLAAFVQGIAKQCTSCITNNSVVFASNTAGNTLVVAVVVCGSTLSTLADTKVDSFTTDASTTIASGGCNLYFRHASAIVGGASNTITATAAGSTSFFTVLVAEFTIITTYESNLASATGTSAAPAVSVNPPRANEIIIGYAGGSADATASGSYAVAAVPSPTTGDVLIYRLAPASGSQSVTFAQTSGAWDAVGLSYK